MLATVLGSITIPIGVAVGSTPVSAALGLRVLLAEDNPVNSKVATLMLAKLGCQVTLVTTGRDALTVLEHGAHDLVLMDVQMPDMDGIEATVAIRAREGSTDARIAIVGMTAHAMHGDRERCLHAGMDDYLAKPVTLAKLAATLEEWRERMTGTPVPPSLEKLAVGAAPAL